MYQPLLFLTNLIDLFVYLVVAGIEPRASCMLDRHRSAALALFILCKGLGKVHRLGLSLLWAQDGFELLICLPHPTRGLEL